MAKASDKEMDFEKAIKELEQIVDKLEDGEVTLEESLKLFEKGVKLSSICQEKLEDARQRVNIITKNADGTIEEEHFESESEM